jgi:hypothetical protein
MIAHDAIEPKGWGHIFVVAANGTFIDLPKEAYIVGYHAAKLIMISGAIVLWHGGIKYDVSNLTPDKIIEERCIVRKTLTDLASAPRPAFGIRQRFAPAFDEEIWTLIAHGEFGNEHAFTGRIGANQDARLRRCSLSEFHGEIFESFVNLRAKTMDNLREGEE